MYRRRQWPHVWSKMVFYLGFNYRCGTTGKVLFFAYVGCRTDIGSQMQALSVIGATQINSGIAPKSVDTGGTSKSDPNAGTDTDASPVITHSPITTKDKAGAGVLTVAVIFVVIGGAIWIIV